MIYLLYGEDSFRSHQKLSQIKQKYLAAESADLNLVELPGETLTAAEFSQQVQTLPFLAKSRLVIIRNLLLSGKKEVQEAIASELSKTPKTTILFFYEAGLPDKRNKLFQILNQPKQAQEFPLLLGNELIRYIIEAFKLDGKILSPVLAQQLVSRIGSDLWRFSQEKEKLVLASGAAPTMSEKLINELVLDQAGLNVFSLTDAFGNRQASVALKALARVTDREASLGLVSLVAGHFRNLLQVADAKQRGLGPTQLNQEIKLHPFVLSKVTVQVRHYQAVELQTVFRYLLDLDWAAKQSLLEPMTGLTVLAASLSRQPLTLPDLTEEAML